MQGYPSGGVERMYTFLPVTTPTYFSLTPGGRVAWAAANTAASIRMDNTPAVVLEDMFSSFVPEVIVSLPNGIKEGGFCQQCPAARSGSV